METFKLIEDLTGGKKGSAMPFGGVIWAILLTLALMAVGVRLSGPLSLGWGNSNLPLKLMFPTVCVVVEVKPVGVEVGSAVQVPKINCVRKIAERKRHTWRVFIDIEKHIKITKNAPRSHKFSMSSWV